jgi:hypothetical protein
MYRRFAAFLFLLSIASTSFAQVIYEPVRYQHGSEQNRYLYGGSDPRLHGFASVDASRVGYHYGGINFHRFDGGNTFNQPSPMYNRDRVYSDYVGRIDASLFGYTVADARNEAYANSPTYFRKADLLANAIVMPDGSRVVPNVAPIVTVEPVRMYAPVQPRRGQIIIIPKNLLDKKLKDFEKKTPSVASATP